MRTAILVFTRLSLRRLNHLMYSLVCRIVFTAHIVAYISQLCQSAGAASGQQRQWPRLSTSWAQSPPRPFAADVAELQPTKSRRNEVRLGILPLEFTLGVPPPWVYYRVLLLPIVRDRTSPEKFPIGTCGREVIMLYLTQFNQRSTMPMLRTYAQPINDTVMVKIPREYASYSFQVILVPCNVTPRPDPTEDIHIFDSLHTDWGGTGSATEIAAAIRSSRHTDRHSVPW